MTNSQKEKEYQRIKRQNQMYELQDINFGSHNSWEQLQKANHHIAENTYEIIAPGIYKKINWADKVKKLSLEIDNRQTAIEELRKQILDPSQREREMEEELLKQKEFYNLRLVDIDNLKDSLKEEINLKNKYMDVLNKLEKQIGVITNYIEEGEIKKLKDEVADLKKKLAKQEERIEKISEEVESIKESSTSALYFW
ncbi:MAG: hypothetical protein I3273_06830 [Candidatus Moeniiplasma glomeromycotorum]|nr:hypothetical protein [Candidatus Moeniiplasma glomeromycotorum]MCE8168155.1 hypothetical protein [Candidatus Moeniiplasma glomeromycotorum]MCE8169800.1 hypothetical protein [Candidatus Moeniiplasma glomeromycotorum]